MDAAGTCLRPDGRLRRECGGVAFPFFLLTLFVSIVLGGTIAFARFSHTNPLSPDFLEETPPEIRWTEEPVGIGADPVTFRVTFSDAGAGLDEVLVRLVHRGLVRGDKITDLVRRRVETAHVHEETVEVSIDPKQLGLKEGNVELQLAAFDKTLWNNGVQLSKIVQVNFLKPRLEVVTPEQNGVLGGSQLVFYRVMGKSPVSQGVNAKGTFYQGFPASLWDPAFKGIQDLYLTLFPLPLDFDASGDRMKITARDDIGNATQVPFGYRIRQRKSSAVRVDLSPERGAQVAQELSAFAREGSLKLTLTKDLFADLKTLLGALQLQDDGILMELLSRTDGRRWWKGPFGRPLPSYPASTFGDARTVTVGGVEVLQEKILGARFPVQNRSTVQAANNGRVAFVGSLGLLGETVVIDHGLGLASIYGHLSQASVKLQDEVTLGQPIGRTGQSGFAQSEEVLFQIRVHGVPVSPNEWWDPTWIKDHIENKVNFVKNTVGVAGP